MALGIIFTALFASGFGIMYMLYTTRNKERMAMIEKGASAELFKAPRQIKEARSKKNYSALKFTLKFGLFLVGIGIGFVLTVLMDQSFSVDEIEMLSVGTVFVCGGIGLVDGYLIGRSTDKRDEQKQSTTEIKSFKAVADSLQRLFNFSKF